MQDATCRGPTPRAHRDELHPGRRLGPCAARSSRSPERNCRSTPPAWRWDEGFLHYFDQVTCRQGAPPRDGSCSRNEGEVLRSDGPGLVPPAEPPEAGAGRPSRQPHPGRVVGRAGRRFRGRGPRGAGVASLPQSLQRMAPGGVGLPIQSHRFPRRPEDAQARAGVKELPVVGQSAPNHRPTFSHRAQECRTPKKQKQKKARRSAVDQRLFGPCKLPRQDSNLRLGG